MRRRRREVAGEEEGEDSEPEALTRRGRSKRKATEPVKGFRNKRPKTLSNIERSKMQAFNKNEKHPAARKPLFCFLGGKCKAPIGVGFDYRACGTCGNDCYHLCLEDNEGVHCCHVCNEVEWNRREEFEDS